MINTAEIDIDILRRNLIVDISGTIIRFLNKGITDNFGDYPETYGSTLTWNNETKKLKFSYWQYGIFQCHIDSTLVRQLLPDEITPLVDCIRNMGVDF